MVHHHHRKAATTNAAMFRYQEAHNSQTALVARPKGQMQMSGGGHCFDTKTADARQQQQFVDLGSETSRSSTPVTDASTRYQTPSSVSSWGTNPGSHEQEERECGYPEGDDEKGEGRWDEESNPQSRSRRSSDSAPAPIHPGSMRSRRPDSVPTLRGGDITSDLDEEDEWSGEDDTLDAAVIAAVNGDLALAAYLIPLLHRSFTSTVRSKVELWQCGGGPGSSEGGGNGARPGTSSSGSNQSGSSPRKRRRRTSSGSGERIGGGGGGGGDDEEDGGDGNGPPPDAAGDGQAPLLACPFHKFDPLKYGIQYGAASSTKGANTKNDYYRPCAGPGFRNIQRLKEHLKRKHTVVQCERCYIVFKSHSHTKPAQVQLEEHMRNPESCLVGDPTLREGISNVQWAALDKQNRKKPQEMHKVDKWFEIWDVLFPTTPRPGTPWYDGLSMGASAGFTQEDENFGNIFVNILTHKVRQGDISLPSDEHTMERLKNVVQQTFSIWQSLKEATDTSSSSLTGISRSGAGAMHHQQMGGPSLLGGSSTHLTGADSQTLQTATTASSLVSMPTYHPHPMAAHPYIGIPMGRQPANGYHHMAGSMHLPANGGGLHQQDVPADINNCVLLVQPQYWVPPSMQFAGLQPAHQHHFPGAQPAVVPHHQITGPSEFYGVGGGGDGMDGFGNGGDGEGRYS